jgi:hypothetical protein
VTFDFDRITESKRAARRRLAARPIVEKLRMLDELRQRALTIRESAVRSAAGRAQKDSSPKPH